MIKGVQCTFEITLKPSSLSNRMGKIMIEEILQYKRLMQGPRNYQPSPLLLVGHPQHSLNVRHWISWCLLHQGIWQPYNLSTKHVFLLNTACFIMYQLHLRSPSYLCIHRNFWNLDFTFCICHTWNMCPLHWHFCIVSH